MTFDALIAPVSRTEFIDRYLGERLLLIQRQPSRFASLLTWPQLNAMLEVTRVSGDRCRVVRKGEVVDPTQWLVAPGHPRGTMFQARRFEKLLREGCTLAVDNVDEWFPRVRELTEACEDVMRIAAGVNLYAGWRTDNGFDLHWDNHDTTILQVAGRKRWTVYAPTTVHPHADQRGGDPPPRPTSEPAWEGVLEDGDLLYMPRGWWHVAVPMDEPTLHLTISWPHKTGVDLLRTIASRLMRHAEVRADLPHLATPEQQAQHIRRLRELVMAALPDDVIERYMRLAEQEIATRPRLGLPESARPASPNVELDSPLRLTAGRRLYFENAPGSQEVRFKVGDSSWSCPAALVPAFSLLRATLPTTFRAMKGAVPPAMAPALEAQLFMMVARDALWVERVAPGERPDAVRQSAVELATPTE